MATWFFAWDVLVHGLRWQSAFFVFFWLFVGVVILGPMQAHDARKKLGKDESPADAKLVDELPRISRAARRRSARIDRRGYL
jgi:hypothetical protein